MTGASEGIGLAIARRLLKEGHRVAIAARAQVGLELARDRLLEAGAAVDSLFAFEMRVGDAASMATGMASLRARWDTIDILVNNAGLIAPASPFGSETSSVLRESLEVNLFGAVYLCEQVLPGMRARGWGRIINIASTAGMNGPLELVSYSTSKGALIAFTKALAVEYAADGVAINAVAPGPVGTSNYRRLKGEAAIVKRALPIPTGRLAEPEDIAEIVSFLAASTSSHLTGQVIAIDGGEQAAGPYAIQWANRRNR